jgi:iron transport multicopper oxidase
MPSVDENQKKNRIIRFSWPSQNFNMHFPIVTLLVAALLRHAVAKEVYYDWHITWVNVAPDGYERPVIGINNQWPCPQIDVDIGDQLVIDVHNDLGNQTTGIHWHGLHQYMKGYMDGAPGVTQCPIHPGQTMRYVVDVCPSLPFFRTPPSGTNKRQGEPNRHILVPFA